MKSTTTRWRHTVVEQDQAGGVRTSMDERINEAMSGLGVGEDVQTKVLVLCILFSFFLSGLKKDSGPSSLVGRVRVHCGVLVLTYVRWFHT